MTLHRPLLVLILMAGATVLACSDAGDDAVGVDIGGAEKIEESGAPAQVRTVTVLMEGALQDRPEFQQTIVGLRKAVARRDGAAVMRSLGDAFFIQRDFGGLYDPDASAAQNFSSVYVLDNSKLGDEYQGMGWRMLERDLATRFALKDGLACGPAEVAIQPPLSQDDESDSLDCFYVDGVGVELKERPSVDSPTSLTLSYEVIELPHPETTDVSERSRPPFIEVQRSSGERGFVEESYVRECLARQLCFIRAEEGEWKIAGVVLGGD